MLYFSFQYVYFSLIVSFTFQIVESCWVMGDPVKNVGIMQFSVVVVLTLLTLLWRIMTDVKYLFTTTSYEISKIDVMVETQKMSPKYTQLLDKLLDKVKTPSFEVSKIRFIIKTQK